MVTKKVLEILSIALAQVQNDKMSENFTNEIQQNVLPFYGAKQV